MWFRKWFCTIKVQPTTCSWTKMQWILIESYGENFVGDSVWWWNLSSLKTYRYPIPIPSAIQHGPQRESNTRLSQPIFLFRGVSSHTEIDPGGYTGGGGWARLLSQTQRERRHLNRSWLWVINFVWLVNIFKTSHSRWFPHFACRLRLCASDQVMSHSGVSLLTQCSDSKIMAILHCCTVNDSV